MSSSNSNVRELSKFAQQYYVVFCSFREPPETKKAIDENRQEGHDAPKKRKKSAAASDILRGVSIDEELTDKDRKFLSAIENNPDILKFGYKDDPNGFRLWLLEKGNDLLQNYPAFRPTFR